MTINGISGANTQAAQIGMNQAMDSYSKNIQNQIANAQKQLQELSSNEEMTLEEKMKKRQEIQQQISDLNMQLRQHQIEQRKEQQSKGASMDDMLGGNRTAAKSKRAVTGKYAGNDFRRFFHEAGKSAGQRGNTDAGQSECFKGRNKAEWKYRG